MYTLEQIREHCEKKGYTSRACRFQVISELLEISPDDAKAVETITRYIREILPVDEVGKRKESEWHMPDYMRPLAENDAWNDMFKRTGLDA